MNLINIPKTRAYLESLMSGVSDVALYRKSFNQIVLDAELGKKGDDTPFPVSMGSFFIDPVAYEEILQKTKILVRAILKVRKEYILGNEEIRNVVRISPEEQMLLTKESFDPDVFGAVRFDFFPTENGVKLCELNSDNPDVILVGNEATQVLFKEKISSEWQEMLEQPKNTGEILLQSMKGSMGDFTTLGVIGPLDRWIIGENHKTMSAMNASGISVVEGNPEDVRYENGKVYIQDTEIHAARRVAELKYFTKNIEKLEGLQTSLKEKKLKLYNQLNDRLLGHKSVFAVLTDTRYDSLFTDAEKAIFKELIPWTRVCQKGVTTLASGACVDLLTHTLEHKDELVLKPSGGSEAEGILIGSVITAELWKQSVENAFSEESEWIIQEAIHPILLPVLIDTENTLSVQEMTADISVHLFYNKENIQDGLLFSRYAPGAINNIIAGGGIIFPYIEKK